jgi:hypothetical protein
MPYDDIPTAGRHPGDDSEHESGTNVRALGPPEPGRYESQPDDAEETSASLFRVARHKTKDTYRVRAWSEAKIENLGDDYEEMGRYESEAELAEGLSDVSEAGKFVVFEDTAGGDVQVGRAAEISGNWTEGGRFDQVMLFDSEEAAAAYAEERQA